LSEFIPSFRKGGLGRISPSPFEGEGGGEVMNSSVKDLRGRKGNVLSDFLFKSLPEEKASSFENQQVGFCQVTDYKVK